jgi:hypothetical protein
MRRRNSEAQATSRSVRAVIVALALSIFVGVPIVLSAIGSARADSALRSVRLRAATAHVDPTKMLAPQFDVNAPNPVATAVAVPKSDVDFRTVDGGWCAKVTVHRLIAAKSAYLYVDQAGSMRSVNQC